MTDFIIKLLSSLAGNRTLYESLLNAVLENHDEDTLEEVIQKICDDKNAVKVSLS